MYAYISDIHVRYDDEGDKTTKNERDKNGRHLKLVDIPFEI